MGHKLLCILGVIRINKKLNGSYIIVRAMLYILYNKFFLKVSKPLISFCIPNTHIFKIGCVAIVGNEIIKSFHPLAYI